MSDDPNKEQPEGKVRESAQEKSQPAEGAKKEPTVVSVKDFQRATAKLQSERDRSQQQVRELTRKLEEALSELQIAKQFGGDEEASEAARNLARSQAALKAGQEEL